MDLTLDFRTGSYLDVLKRLEPTLSALAGEELQDRYPIVAKIEPDHDCHTELWVSFRLPNRRQGRVVIWADDPWPDATSLRVSFSAESWDPSFRVYFKLNDDDPIGSAAALDKIVDLIVQFVVSGVRPEGTLGLEESQVFQLDIRNTDRPDRAVMIPSVGIEYDKEGHPQPLRLHNPDTTPAEILFNYPHLGPEPEKEQA